MLASVVTGWGEMAIAITHSHTFTVLKIPTCLFTAANFIPHYLFFAMDESVTAGPPVRQDVFLTVKMTALAANFR